jgi:hypothetical protein
MQDALGAELFAFREGGGRHTLVSLAGPLFVPLLGADAVELVFAVHEAGGAFVGAWHETLRASDTRFLGCEELARRVPGAPSDGALVVWIRAPTATHPHHHVRACAMLDAYDDDGALYSLHADQFVVAESNGIELTEIVLEETEPVRTSLVVVNGPEPQPPGALRVAVRSARGETRGASYAREMAPFSVHTIVLRELFPDLVALCGGVTATLEGTFSARRLFTRPWVVTGGALVSGYHGGDRYRMASIPRLCHRTFPYGDGAGDVPREMMLVAGRKETNPAYAVHRPGLTTRLHLFQSHGDVDDDFAVDATLHDRSGRVVVHRERWAAAPRRGARTVDLAELTAGAPFEGHVALRFSDDAKESFPRRLQALLEYRTPASVARTMLWSDRWNAPDRLLAQRTYRAAYRVLGRGRHETTLAVTNPGVSLDYDREAPYVLRLRSATGEERTRAGRLSPHGTDVVLIDDAFPDRPDEPALVTVESAFDLASIQLTRDVRSGVVAAEHLLAVAEREGETLFVPCGA